MPRHVKITDISKYTDFHVQHMKMCFFFSYFSYRYRQLLTRKVKKKGYIIPYISFQKLSSS